MDKETIIGKGGQIAIWVILAVVLVSSIVLFFLVSRGPRLVVPSETDSAFDVEFLLKNCVKEYVENAVDLILPQGGFIAPENYEYFNNTEIEFLCQNLGFYKPCIQQHPLLFREIKNELKNYIEPKIENECLPKIVDEIQKKQGETKLNGPLRIGVNLNPDRINLKIEKNVRVIKKGDMRKFNEFNIEIRSPLYNLAKIAIEIASQEAEYCYFEYVGYSILYPKYKITKYTNSNGNKIYSILDKESGKVMNIAIRGCAVPSGM